MIDDGSGGDDEGDGDGGDDDDDGNGRGGVVNSGLRHANLSSGAVMLSQQCCRSHSMRASALLLLHVRRATRR